MNISSRCEYACRAVIELAVHQEAQETITSVTIAEKRHIPEKYLVHILLQLKRAGIVRSVRGAQGGYMLSRPAEDISLLDIVQAIDGPVLDPLPVDDDQSDELRPTWRKVARGIEESLAAITVREIADAAGATEMYFI
ncbi:MAG TPA: Rrf2 family transcriptional regulator [Candidatus Hydrogenedentes bacterium]|nr:Rrf2 family transcriptional regulator [Candidatus Hydrogenedentota bacterium]